MTLRRLSLAIQPNAWRKYVARRVDPAFRVFRDKVHARDHHTCQFCGFQAKTNQEVINIDANYANNRIENMLTACCFCAQCHFLNIVGMGDYGGGRLIYMPEMSQSELNALCHVLFCAIANGTAYSDTAQKVYRNLRFRAQAVDQHYGEGLNKPMVFSQLILSREPKQAKQLADELLTDLRLLPTQSRFQSQIDAWAAAAMEDLPEK